MTGYCVGANRRNATFTLVKIYLNSLVSDILFINYSHTLLAVRTRHPHKQRLTKPLIETPENKGPPPCQSPP